jgi:hypothetical protein
VGIWTGLNGLIKKWLFKGSKFQIIFEQTKAYFEEIDLIVIIATRIELQTLESIIAICNKNLLTSIQSYLKYK